MTVIDYLIFFIFIVTPFLYASYLLVFYIINSKEILKFDYFNISIMVIIFIAVLLRLFVVFNVSNEWFQHDYGGHKDAILYYAQYPFLMPQVDKSLQFPQQNLYYLVSGGIYNIATNFFGLSEYRGFFILRLISVLYAFGFLIFGYKLISKISSNNTTKLIFIGFLAFTPSFVWMSARVNNDTLNSLLGMMILYFLVCYHKRPILKNFIFVTLGVILAVMTKISSLLFALVFVFILFVHYFKFSNLKLKNIAQQRIFIFGILVCFVFGYSLLRVHIPVLHEFHFVNSTLYFGQIIPSLDLNYFISFNLFDLINDAQSFVLGKDSIRFSFLTYQYGTMFLGEYDYRNFYNNGGLLKLSAQFIYILGTVYILGLLSYFVFFNKLDFIKKIMLIILFINFLLVIKFLADYWDVCNSDFRYYTPVFGAIAVIFSIGLENLILRYYFLSKYILTSIVILHLLQIYWLFKIVLTI